MSGGNGGHYPRPADERDVQIARLENRIHELSDKVEELVAAVNRREGQLRAHESVNTVQGKRLAEVHSALSTLVDYLERSEAGSGPAPEHLRVYIDGARKVLESRR